jgi:hypothetical protein
LQKLTRGDAAEIIYALASFKPTRGFIYSSDRRSPIRMEAPQAKFDNSPAESQESTIAPETAVKEALKVLRKDNNSSSALIEANNFETDRRFEQSLKNPMYVRKYRGELRSMGLIREPPPEE